jgi:hypothetical protein
LKDSVGAEIAVLTNVKESVATTDMIALKHMHATLTHCAESNPPRSPDRSTIA